MTGRAIRYQNARLFDGQSLHENTTLQFENGVLSHLAPSEAGVDAGIDLKGDIVSPGFVDLQVNGGGGLMVAEAPSVETLRTIAAVHRSLGTLRCLPTLITDTPEVTKATIEAAVQAIESGVLGVTGLHLEGPHLSVARKGAHRADLIRPMDDTDLQLLLDAATRLPVLKVTVAPENTTEHQVKTLTNAGIIVALGHTNADYKTCLRYFEAGARVVTHLFNAMPHLQGREPGPIGAALASGHVSAGIIADGIHVHPASLAAAWNANRGPGGLFLVSDAMAVAGTALDEFSLNGRKIKRENNALTLSDGTLAGADLTLVQAVKVMVEQVGVPLGQALYAATTRPAEVVGMPRPTIAEGHTNLSDLIRIDAALTRAAPLVEAH